MVEIDIQSVLILFSVLTELLSWLWGVYQNWKNPKESEILNEVDVLLIDSLQAHMRYLELAKKGKLKPLIALLEREIERIHLQLEVRGCSVKESEIEEEIK
jgi:hypothetical protein